MGVTDTRVEGIYDMLYVSMPHIHHQRRQKKKGTTHSGNWGGEKPGRTTCIDARYASVHKKHYSSC
jgi:hypothetical protein